MKRKMKSTRSSTPIRTIRNSMAMILVAVMLATISFPASAAVTGRVTPGQIRSTVVSRMQAMMTVPWKATSTTVGGISGLTVGQTYYGIPYSQSYNTRYTSFLSMINGQGQLTQNCGIDCSTAAVYAWLDAGALDPNQYSHSTLAGWNTQTMVEKATNAESSNKDGVIIVSGSTTVYSSSTTRFVRNISRTNYDNWLKNAKAGDILVRHDTAGGTSGHAVVVTNNNYLGRIISVIEIGGGPSATQWNTRTLSYDSWHWPTDKLGGYMPITTTRMTTVATYVYDDLPGIDAIKYRAHVQDIGWQGEVYSPVGGTYNPITAGTIGQSKRVESIKIQLSGLCGSVIYKTHVQDVGWTGWSYDGAASGTIGESKRVEAIQIKLTGYAETNYDIYYRAHVENCGWLHWAKNGGFAGTMGYGWRLEAMEIVLVPKGGNPPGPTTNPYWAA